MPMPALAPGPAQEHQHQGGKDEAVGGCALRADHGKQALGKRGARAQGHQTAHQGGDGPQELARGEVLNQEDFRWKV